MIRNSNGERLDVAFHKGAKEGKLVILGHGLTGSKDSPLLFWMARYLAARGWPCVRVSYSGNGKSEGAFSESNITKGVGDLLSLIDQVGSGKKIIYVGHSMGAAIGVLAAARDERIRGLVSLAGMVYARAFCDRTLREIISGEGYLFDDKNYPLSPRLMEDLIQVENCLEAVRVVRVPWLLVHGGKDDVIPLQESRDALAVHRGKHRLIELEYADHFFTRKYEAVNELVFAWLEELPV